MDKQSKETVEASQPKNKPAIVDRPVAALLNATAITEWLKHGTRL